MQPRTPLYQLASNLTSLIGVVLVTTAGVLWLLLLPSWWRGETNPYIGILTNMALPVLFFVGLGLIPLGIWMYHRKRRKLGDSGPILPRGNELRRLAIFMAVTTFINLIIGSQFLYSAVSYMDSDAFCGRACHTVMNPEYTAYTNSPHARVSCTECHIGAGANWFVRSKITGTKQLFAVLFHSYPTPIESPVKALRPARDTCQHCHWPQRFAGDIFMVKNEFAADETNTPSTTVALMRVGGQNWKGTVGIHGAHSDAKGKMEYVAIDRQRQVIPQVTYTSPDGKVTVYKATDNTVKPDQISQGEHRTMDCMDCHNRPSHTFQLPERAVDLAMAQGRISPKLPFIKKQAIEVLRREYPDGVTANNQIATSLTNFYASKFPGMSAGDTADLKTAIKGVQTIYEQNVFPEMKITWGTYPNNLGHTDFPGCFRCHDGNHASADGRTISNDCATCHDLLAVGEKNPKILSDLGMKPKTEAGAVTK